MECEECRQRLSEFAAGETPQHEAAAVQEHVEQCAACARLLAAMRATADLVEALPDEEPPRSLVLRILGRVEELSAPDLAEAPEIMTLEQAARFLQVPPAKLESELVTLPAFEIAGELRIRRDRLLTWVEERERARERMQIYSRLRAV